MEEVSPETIEQFNFCFDYEEYKKMRAYIQKILDKALDQPDFLNSLQPGFDYVEPYSNQNPDLLYFASKTLTKKLNSKEKLYVEYSFNIYYNEEERFGFIDYVDIGATDEKDNFAEYVCSFEPYRINLFLSDQDEPDSMNKFL